MERYIAIGRDMKVTPDFAGKLSEAETMMVNGSKPAMIVNEAEMT